MSQFAALTAIHAKANPTASDSNMLRGYSKMNKRIIEIALIFCSALAWAQTPAPTPIVQPHVTFVDASGNACAGCALWTYAAGTTTPQATYTDATGTSQNTNPIVLDPAGGAQIWLGSLSYKFILKDASGVTIWSVDQVNASQLYPCPHAAAIQIANSALNGFACDATITIDTVNHTVNVGTLPANHVTIGPLGTPTSWNLDTTSPTTARTSLGMGSGTIGQLGYFAAGGTVITGTSAIPSGITATTQAVNDNSTNIATTAYVQTPGAIKPTSVKVGTGIAMNDNQGTGLKIQHSTGTTTTDDCAKFDANGNVIDSGAPCPASTHTLTNCMTTTCVGGSTYVAGTSYTNTSTHVLAEMVSIHGYDPTGGCTGPSGLLTGVVNGNSVLFTEINNDCNTANISGFTLIVPPGATFQASISTLGSGGTYLLNSWYEMTL